MSRREEIIAAVIETLKEKRFAGDFTLSSVAKEVNIGKSTIYEYFSNKDELMKASLATFIQNTTAEVTLDIDIENYSFKELFIMQITKLLETANNTRIIIESFAPKFTQRFSDDSREEMKAVMMNVKENVRKRFEDYFTKGIKEGALQQDKVAIHQLVIPSMVIGSIMLYTDPSMNLDSNVIAVQLYDAVVKLCN